MVAPSRGEWTTDDIKTMLGVVERVSKERDELQAEVERLRAALLEAAETVQEWGSQAPDYAQEKVGLAEEIERIRATATRGG